MKQWGVGPGGGEIFWPQLKTMLKIALLWVSKSAKCELGAFGQVRGVLTHRLMPWRGKVDHPILRVPNFSRGLWLQKSMGFSWGTALAQQSQQIMFLSGCRRCSFALAPHSHVLPCFTPARQSHRLLLGCIVCWLRQELFTSSCAAADKTCQDQNQNTDPQQATFGIFTEPVPQKLLLIAPALDQCSNDV